MKTLSKKFLSFVMTFWVSVVFAQSDEVMNLQMKVRDPSGNLIDASSVNVRLQIFAPSSGGNQCLLRDEYFSTVSIAKGFLKLSVGSGTKTSTDPGKTFKELFSNSQPITGLNCYDGNGSVNPTVTTYNPGVSDSRVFRVSIGYAGDNIVVTFNNSVTPRAIVASQSENSLKLSGKAASDFLQIPSGQTSYQTRVNSLVSDSGYAIMSQILGGTYAVSSGQVSGLGPLATMTTTGTASASTYLRGDGTWATISGGGGGSGTVTSVTGTSPIQVADNTTTPVISISNATTAAKGAVQIGDGLAVSSGVVSLPDTGTAGTYGSNYQVPVITTDSKGRISGVTVSSITINGSAITAGTIDEARLPSLDATKIATGVLDKARLPSDVVYNGGSSAIGVGGAAVSSALLSVSSTTSGFLIPRMTASQRDSISSPATGLQVYNADTNQINYYNGSSWQALGLAGSSVTSIAAGTGLTGGTITSTGTLSVDVGTTANKIVQLDGSARLPAVDASQVTGITASQIPSLDAAKITTGTFTASQIPNLDWSKITTGKPTTISGYGITNAVTNAGSVSSIQSGLDASKGSASTVGRLFVATDTEKVYYDDGSNWLQVASNAGAGGTVTSVSGSGPISVSNGTTTPNISIATANGSTTGALSSSDWTNFNNKLGTSLTSGQIFVGNASNVATGVTLSGDATITNAGVLTVSKIQNRNIAGAAPSNGQVLKWNNTSSQWEPSADIDTTYTAGTGLTLSAGAFSISTVPVANGGTGATTPADARTNLGITATGDSLATATSAANARSAISAAASGANADITSMTQNVDFSSTGAIKVPSGTTAQQPGSPSNGMIRYNADNNAIEARINGAWSNIATTAEIPNNTNYVDLTSNQTVAGNKTLSGNTSVGGTLGVTGAATLSSTLAVTGNVNINSGKFFVDATNTRIGVGTATPNTTSLMDLTSTTAGFLMPRMTTTQRDAITTPATGLQVYNTTTNQINYYNGSAWQALGVSGAGVQSITAGAGLTGGTITSTGTVAVDVGTTANKIVQLDGSARLPAVDASQVTGLTASQIPNLDAAKITTGTFTASQIPSLDAAKISTGTIPIARGGTNSGTTLNNNRVMISSSGAIVESPAITASRAIASDANGLPVASTTSTTELGYLTGVTSAVQTQLNAKASSSGWTNYSVITSNGSGALTAVAGSSAGQMLNWTVTGPAWTTATFPTSTTANQLLYSSANNVVGGLATANNAILTTNGSGVPSWTALSGDAFTQYALLAGRSGGQTINGGTAASENLTLDSTGNATKGNIILNPSGGNVGIGTNSPSSKLHVAGNTTLSSGSSLIFGTSQYSFIEGTEGGSSYLRFSTVGSERLRISSAGNIGIGTTNPGYKLVVTSNTGTLSSNVSTNIAQFAAADGTGTGVQAESYGSGSHFRIQRANGTTASPTAVVNNDVIGGMTWAGYNGSTYPTVGTFRVVATNDFATSVDTALVIATAKAGSASERFRIDADGRVGIGTAAPTGFLHLKAGTAAANTAPLKLTAGTNLTTPEAGAIEFDGTSLYYTDSTNTRRALASTTGTSSISNSGGNITLSPIATSGSVLIDSGTASVGSTSGALVVTGGAGISGALNVGGNIGTSGAISAGTTISAATSVTAPTLLGSSSASANLTIDSTSNATKGNILLNPSGGKVGIGTSTPTSVLVVKDSAPESAGATTMSMAALSNTITFSNPVTLNAGDVLVSSAGGRYVVNSSGTGTSFTSPIYNWTTAVSGQTFTIERPSRLGQDSNGVAKIVENSTAGGLYIGSPGAFGSTLGGMVITSTGTTNPDANRQFRMQRFSDNTAGSILVLSKARGSVASPSPVQSGDILGAINFLGWGNDTSNTPYGNMASAAIIRSLAEAAPTSSGAVPAYLQFQTVNTSGSLGEKMRITADGRVGIGTGSPTSSLEVVNSSNNNIAAFTAVEPIVKLSSLGGTNPATLEFNSSDSARISSVGSYPMIFYVNGSESARFNPGGGLQVNGTVKSNAVSSAIDKTITYTPADFNSATPVYKFAFRGGVYGHRYLVSIRANMDHGMATFILDAVNQPDQVRVIPLAYRERSQYYPIKILARANTNNSFNNYYDFYVAAQSVAQNAPSWMNDIEVTVTPIFYDRTEQLPSETAGGYTTEVPLDLRDYVWTKSDGSNSMVIKADTGAVGIGTSSPGSYPGQAMLDVKSTSHTVSAVSSNAGNLARIALASGSQNWLIDNVGTFVSPNNRFRILEPTSYGEMFTILPTSGNIGMGVSNPSEKLEVSGNVKATSFISTSDLRLKDNVRNIAGLSTIEQLNGVHWNWKSNGKGDYGVIAQDVEKVMPEAVVNNEQTGLKAVKYQALFAPVIQSIKEILAWLRNQDQQIESLKTENNQMKAWICEKDPSAPFCLKK